MERKKPTKQTVQEELKELLEEGTPRQKALFICKNWYDPTYSSLYGGKPTITQREKEQVEDSLYDYRAKAAFNKWIGYYDLYNSLVQLTGLGIAEYEKKAKELVGYLKMWDMYYYEGRMINSIYLEIKAQGNEKRTSSYENMIGRTAQPTQYAKLARREDGSFYFDVTDLYENYIKPTQNDVNASYSALKALLDVLDNHTKKHNSKEFIPAALQYSINRAKQGYKAHNLDPRFSCEALRKKKERGEPVTEEEEKQAVFPEYKTLQVNPQIKAHFEAVLKRKEKQ